MSEEQIHPDTAIASIGSDDILRDARDASKPAEED